MKFKHVVLALFTTSNLFYLQAQSLKEQALVKIDELTSLITLAESESVNVEKEKMTLRTAEVFTRYADWDQANQTINNDLYGSLSIYRNGKVDQEGRNLSKVVQDLPDIQRQQIIDIIDEAIVTINNLRDNTITRKDLRTVNFENVRIKKVGNEDRVVERVNGIDVPTLFYTYTFKPSTVLSDINNSESEKISLTEFHGNTIDLFITPAWSLEDESLSGGFTFNLNRAKGKQNIGRVFMDHRNLPEHLADNTNAAGAVRSRNDSESIYAGQRLFMRYDIDNPDVRQLMENLYGTAVPMFSDENFTELGYLLANEPHWGTIEDTFFTPTPSTNGNCVSPDVLYCNQNIISRFTMLKFAEHLKSVYGTGAAGITSLNTNWYGTDTSKYLSSFDDIAGTYNPNQKAQYAIEFPIKKKDVGSPIVYDWFNFNNLRVTEWFQFLHDIIEENDPDLKTNIKLIPQFFFGDETRHAGLDFEALQEVQEMIGNDAEIIQRKMFGQDGEWVDRYNFNWGEMSITYDFLSSVKPNAINYNSEAHYLSTTQFRNLYLEPSYTRASFWLAYMHSENVSNIWVFSRNEDGSARFNNNEKSFYPGTLGNQPAVVNEIGSVFYDLNAYADQVYKIQNLPKPIRIFHSETSAINKIDHMEPIFDLYETMYFDGIPLGFATKNIINNQDNALWDVILVYETPSVTDSEFEALQTYLNSGGTLVLDANSLKVNEYNQPRAATLNTANGGKIIRNNSLAAYRGIALAEVESRGNTPALTITENQDVNNRGCFWRTLPTDDGKNLVTLINLRKGNSTVEIDVDNASNIAVTDLLTGQKLTTTIELEPNEMLLLEVANSTDGSLSIDDFDNTHIDKSIRLYPNPVVNSNLSIDFNKTIPEGTLKLYSIGGSQLMTKDFKDSSDEIINFDNLSSGIYFIQIIFGVQTLTYEVIKN